MAFENFFATKLYTAIDATTTTITLETVPTVSPGHLVIESRNATNREIIKYTGITGNQVTGVTRGVGGTSAKTHEKNALVEMNVVAQDLQDALNAPDNLAQYASEIGGDFIVSRTGVVAQTTGLTASFSNITYYINGYRYTKSSIANKTYTASKDTYIFIGTNGNITYTEVANNAAAPTTPTNSILVAVVVTSASAITSVGLKNRGAIKAQNVDSAVLGDYSLSEVNTGRKWLDGRAIYKKTFANSTFPSTAGAWGYNRAHGIANFSMLVKWEGNGLNNSNSSVYSFPLLDVMGQRTTLTLTRADATNLIFDGYDSKAQFNTTNHITIYYVKTS